jgi:hypothetical protein
MAREGVGGEGGQALVLLVGGLVAVLAGVFVLGAVARGVGLQGEAQRAADLAALAAARAMHAAYPRLFEPAVLDGMPNPRHMEKAAYVALARAAAGRVAAANGGEKAAVAFPDGGSFAPVRIRVQARRRVAVAGRGLTLRALAEVELGADAGGGGFAHGGGYDGPLAMRQGKPMRPDVAAAFDRMAAAAAADGIRLLITNGFRSDAEQAVLFARHPDPKWVAPPGKSLHRYGTELDLGPAAAYGWLAANAPRFHVAKRYEWEDWHFGSSTHPALRGHSGQALNSIGDTNIRREPGADRGPTSSSSTPRPCLPSPAGVQALPVSRRRPRALRRGRSAHRLVARRQDWRATSVMSWRRGPADARGPEGNSVPRFAPAGSDRTMSRIDLVNACAAIATIGTSSRRSGRAGRTRLPCARGCATAVADAAEGSAGRRVVLHERGRPRGRARRGRARRPCSRAP